jgi:hypothetical protein
MEKKNWKVRFETQKMNNNNNNKRKHWVEKKNPLTSLVEAMKKNPKTPTLLSLLEHTYSMLLSGKSSCSLQKDVALGHSEPAPSSTP